MGRSHVPVSGLKSENIGGILSFAGSLLPLAAGDVQSIAAAACFAFSEVTFARAGHTVKGYSLGAAGFAIGDYLLAASAATQANTALQLALVAMGAAWTIGVLRYPLEAVAAASSNNRPVLARRAAAASRVIQPVVGVSCLALRVPGLLTAAAGRNVLMLGAIGLWAASDVLCGRLQRYAVPATRYLKSLLMR